MTPRVLCLLTDGFEEIETVAPIDLLRRAGVEVTVAALESPEVTGRSGIRLVADAILSDVLPDHHDLLFLPGGPGVVALRADGRPAALAKMFHQAGKRIAAICAAPLVLKDAGILGDRRHTAHASTHVELPHALQDERVVVDGNLITSRGAGTSIDFGLALVAELRGRHCADEIAAAIMA
jgi:4-methyl-5(b-hydroxyethyl)-thiazole monophosphate biosynthesis